MSELTGRSEGGPWASGAVILLAALVFAGVFLASGLPDEIEYFARPAVMMSRLAWAGAFAAWVIGVCLPRRALRLTVPTVATLEVAAGIWYFLYWRLVPFGALLRTGHGVWWALRASLFDNPGLFDMVAGCAGGFCLGYLVAFTFRLYPSRKTSAVVLLVLLALVVVVYMYVNPARVK